MKIDYATNAKYGVNIHGFDVHQADKQQINDIKELIYKNNIAVLKNQRLTPQDYVKLGHMFGRVEAYYEPMYHHAEEKEIFVSSNVSSEGKVSGVPKTGKFWHTDYAFMPEPFAFTLIYPQIVPSKNRGTYFIDMAEAYRSLPDKLKSELEGVLSCHSPRRYFKIRPDDVYRPVCELLADIEEKTPPVTHPATFAHPVTGETILYISEAFTYLLKDARGNALDNRLLNDLLEATGQLDTTFTHPLIHLQTFTQGDLLIWDNRRLIHRSLHTKTPEPAESYRITVHDDHPFYHAAPLAEAD